MNRKRTLVMLGENYLLLSLFAFNILKSERNISGDFGISKEVNTAQQASTVIGTPMYLAPEKFKGERKK